MANLVVVVGYIGGEPPVSDCGIYMYQMPIGIYLNFSVIKIIVSIIVDTRTHLKNWVPETFYVCADKYSAYIIIILNGEGSYHHSII
jgi:hypothetical protein